MGLQYWVSQIISLIAYILFGFGLRKQKKLDLLIYSSFFHLFMLVHYLLLSGYLGMISSVIALIRNMVFIYNERKQKENSKVILSVFTIVTIILTAIFYTKPIDILPCTLTVLGLYLYCCTSMNIIRLGNIAISICYILYGISINSWFSICCEIYLIINTFIGYMKHKQ